MQSQRLLVALIVYVLAAFSAHVNPLEGGAHEYHTPEECYAQVNETKNSADDELRCCLKTNTYRYGDGRLNKGSSKDKQLDATYVLC